MEDQQENWYKQDNAPPPPAPVSRGDRKMFWLRSDEKTHVTFVDDVPFQIWEHDAKIGGQWGNRFTCINGMGPEQCPGCPPPRSKRNWINRYWVGYVTVVSEREFEYQGRVIKNIRRLFQMKRGLLKVFNEYKETKGDNLVGARFRLWRTGDKAFKVGDNWMFDDFIDGTKGVPEEEVRKIMSRHYDYQDPDGVPLTYEPFDYRKFFVPQTAEEISSMLGLVHAEGPQPGAPIGASPSSSPFGQKVDI